MELPILQNENCENQSENEEREIIVREILSREINRIQNVCNSNEEISMENESAFETSSSPGTVILRQPTVSVRTQHRLSCNAEQLHASPNRSREIINSGQTRTGRRRWWWPRRWNPAGLRSSPEQLNVRIPIGGSISYRSYFPQDFEAYLPLDRNAPPTYTPVMSSTCPHDIHCNSFITPTPPPTYAQAMGASEIEASPDTVLELMVTTLWGHSRQPAYCFICRLMVFTQVKHRLSRFTHMSAVTLCFLGCWPCCLLPYCISYFKTTYHYCPTCGACLGVYSLLDDE
ncbi:uncharacterized protein isoform X2 [Rhodnius prolixus]